ncbi:hypothetical protein, variant 1 [Aphanomyces invadans]|uniref:PWWP domain-containing protein n=1 Tax=Aphanomyces invadans TaxID=157072 RepID=A0A024UFH2_9STRA|nr:hypothetical protein, variant 1 [Aphanomyces invadans]ETW05024.1 hypothetical protein, variant 1 [Aphanomyces invadans]|eukprot:XP_008866461.1 hypothetical protein, variant 1 [Aphanomyces invadans]
MAYGGVGWASTDGRLWWPVYLCDPHMLADELHILGKTHHRAVQAHKKKHTPVVYYLGTYEFEAGKAQIKEWFCPEFDHFAQEPSLPERARDDWCRALAEAQRIRVNGVVPYLLPSDLNKRLSQPRRTCPATEGSIIWIYTRGFPWRPCFVLDPMCLTFTGGHEHFHQFVRLAQKEPDTYMLLYFFGNDKVQLRNRSRAEMKAWECPEHDGFLRGIPRTAQSRGELLVAVQSAKQFLQAGCDLNTLVLPGITIHRQPLPRPPCPPLTSDVVPPSPLSKKPKTSKSLQRQQSALDAMTLVTKSSPSPRSSNGIMKILTYPCGMAWAKLPTMWTPIIMCQPDEWRDERARGHGKRYNDDAYFFATRSIRKWRGRVKPWRTPKNGAFAAVLTNVGLHDVYVEAMEYFAQYEKLEVKIRWNPVE